MLATLANALMLWRHSDSMTVCEQALAAASAVGDDRPAVRAMGILGVNHCYLGQPEAGLARVTQARRLAEALGSARDVVHSYAHHCEVLVATGRVAEASRTALDGIAAARRLGVERSFGALLSAYAAEALLELGDWRRI